MQVMGNMNLFFRPIHKLLQWTQRELPEILAKSGEVLSSQNGGKCGVISDVNRYNHFWDIKLSLGLTDMLILLDTFFDRLYFLAASSGA